MRLQGTETQYFKKTLKKKSALLSSTFPQGFQISKNFGHPTLGSGGKKKVKRYVKSEQTHRHTCGLIDL